MYFIHCLTQWLMTAYNHVTVMSNFQVNLRGLQCSKIVYKITQSYQVYTGITEDRVIDY